MTKPTRTTLFLLLFVGFTVLDAQAADYLAGQEIERPSTFDNRLGKAFLPGLRQPASSPYSTSFAPEHQSSYVFTDDFVKPSNVLSNRDRDFTSGRDVPDAPVSNVFKLSY
jgi:hypothetical protein